MGEVVTNNNFLQLPENTKNLIWVEMVEDEQKASFLIKNTLNKLKETTIPPGILKFNIGIEKNKGYYQVKLELIAYDDLITNQLISFVEDVFLGRCH